MESISKVSNLLEAARELTLEASRDASSARRPLRPLPPAQIQKLLDSRSERDVLEGLRRVIALQYTASLSTTLPFFPAVLKTLSHPTSSTRPLVYAYLTHHAEADPDTALLAINTIQKSLSDSSPKVRAMALRTMSGLRMPVISQIVSLAIKRGVADMSPIVRKTAAFACVKCVRLDPSTLPQVTDYLAQLIGDVQYYVAGAAVAAFMEVCPERLDLVHKHYRSLVKKLVDMDEWGQLAALRLLTIYSRQNFPYHSKQIPKAQASVLEKSKSFYEEDASPSQVDQTHYVEQQILDPDLELLLTAALPLLQSRTSAVILAVTNAYLSLAPSHYLHHTIGPLVALLRSPDDIRPIALANIVQVAIHDPSLFVPHHRRFILHHTDTPQIFDLKLELLTLMFPHCTADIQSLVLADLEHFSRSQDMNITRLAVRAIGRCAQSSSSSTSGRCLRLLLRQVDSTDENLVAEALEVIRHLIQQNPSRHKKTVVRLAKKLDELRSDKARASVIWLVGEFAGFGRLEDSIAPDVLRILVKGYAEEADEVKGQIVLLAAKIYCLWCSEMAKEGGSTEDGRETTDQGDDPLDEFKGTANGVQDATEPKSAGNQLETGESGHAMELLWQHVLLLARYTPSYDLRDRARLFRALLSVRSSTELASLLLLAPKPVPQAPSPSESRRGFQLGSASLVVGEEAGVHGLKGYEPLPDWVKPGDEPDPRLRDAAGERPVNYAVPRPAAGKTLDDVLKNDRNAGSQASSFKEKTPVSLDDWLNEESKPAPVDESAEESELETEEEEEESDESEDEDEEESADETQEEESEEESSGDERQQLVK
ncbi:hypothetical protein CAC42_5304 [Sphaceloma murrayae]|uniref:Clathrin/coatomer adaptor adaptin-like N-terminal domain-containing protein n=1 Tax=Sphaceloma murrayae TaxID=2082308 RepID=A0A2K1QUM6_9PEZI|nr:hypothetical protein CAC42_5304 [Sphaceloma murrayae]